MSPALLANRASCWLPSRDACALPGRVTDFERRGKQREAIEIRLKSGPGGQTASWHASRWVGGPRRCWIDASLHPNPEKTALSPRRTEMPSHRQSDSGAGADAVIPVCPGAIGRLWIAAKLALFRGRPLTGPVSAAGVSRSAESAVLSSRRRDPPLTAAILRLPRHFNFMRSWKGLQQKGRHCE